MIKVNSTEIQNNFGKYLMLAQDQDIIITRNGREVAKLSAVASPKQKDAGYVREDALSDGYTLGKATYEEFVELTKNTTKRYEYIHGEIFLLSSPKSNHQLTLGEIYGIFYNYFRGKACLPVIAPYNITVKLANENINVVQPDVMVICDLEQQLGEDGYYKGVPTLVVEIISESSRGKDLVKKLGLYMVSGVQEYWIVDPENKMITIYTFKDKDVDQYITYTGAAEAVSETFPGLAAALEQVFPLIK